MVAALNVSTVDEFMERLNPPGNKHTAHVATTKPDLAERKVRAISLGNINTIPVRYWIYNAGRPYVHVRHHTILGQRL